MGQIFVRTAVAFIGAVIAISTAKTILLSFDQPSTDRATQYVLTRNDQGGRTIYPVLDGSDCPMPFSQSVGVSSRRLGMSKMVYAVYPGTTLRDFRYPTFWR